MNYEKIGQEIVRKYNRKIDQQQESIRALKNELEDIRIKNAELEAKNQELKDWVDRLLEYTEMTEEEQRDFIASGRSVQHMEEILNLFEKNAIYKCLL